MEIDLRLLPPNLLRLSLTDCDLEGMSGGAPFGLPVLQRPLESLVVRGEEFLFVPLSSFVAGAVALYIHTHNLHLFVEETSLEGFF